MSGARPTGTGGPSAYWADTRLDRSEASRAGLIRFSTLCNRDGRLMTEGWGFNIFVTMDRVEEEEAAPYFLPDNSCHMSAEDASTLMAATWAWR